MSSPRVQARGLGRAYRGRDVLVGVDLDVAEGEVLGVIGPNGGGKSTLLLMMAGLVSPTAGTLTVDGAPATEVALTRRGTVGLITADAGLYPLLTGRENLRFFGGLYGLGPAEVDRRAAPLIEALDLTDALDRPAAEGSSGMRQKLSLCRALLMSPRLLLLDEPTANLDPLAARVIYAVAREQAAAGVTVVLVTHDLYAAEHLCDRVLLVAGRVVHAEAFAAPRSPPPEGRLLSMYRAGSA